MASHEPRVKTYIKDMKTGEITPDNDPFLKPVEMLETVYPCWAYAFRRIGKPHLLDRAFLETQVPKLAVENNPEVTFAPGDILMWEGTGDEIVHLYKPTFIKPDGRIIFMPTTYGTHVGVYEGDGLFSDIVVPPHFSQLPFEIRMRQLASLDKKPNKVLLIHDLIRL